MKQEKAITLITLIIYVIVMVIVITTISAIILNFKENNNAIQASGKDIFEISNFNTYFLKEIKTPQNSVEDIGDGYILFSTGNSFSLVNNTIKYNNIKISKNVKALNFNLDETDNSIVTVDISFENFTKKIKYKIEEIF